MQNPRERAFVVLTEVQTALQNTRVTDLKSASIRLRRLITDLKKKSLDVTAFESLLTLMRTILSSRLAREKSAGAVGAETTLAPGYVLRTGKPDTIQVTHYPGGGLDLKLVDSDGSMDLLTCAYRAAVKAGENLPDAS
jgi:hypothetical protein